MTDKSANKMWGGRFKMSPAEVMQEINASVGFDKALAPHDIRASKAHAAMLGQQGIISKEDARKIAAGLDRVMAEIERGEFQFSAALEDVHMNVESRLKELIGEPASRLHTARSRNDQVATDFRLYVRDWIDGADAALAGLQLALARKAERHADVIMPGFTHLQPAQPVTFGHHLLAYVEMLARDRGRLADARARLNESPLGAAALAGTSFPIDRHKTAEALGFARPCANSLDAVSDRDFVLETLAAAAIAAMHLSRLADEIVLWVTPQFGFVRLSDRFTTGSSIMPQKRNPDAAELARAKVGRIAAAFQGLLMVMKGLPLAYAKDMQEDKEPTFDALASLQLALAAMTGMVEDLEPDAEAMRQRRRRRLLHRHRPGGLAGARAGPAVPRGAPYHRPDRRGGRGQGRRPRRAAAGGHAGGGAAHHRGGFSVLSVESSVRSRSSYGGTAPQNVRKMAKAWIKRLEKQGGKD